eukprot:gene14013-18794_t
MNSPRMIPSELNVSNQHFQPSVVLPSRLSYLNTSNGEYERSPLKEYNAKLPSFTTPSSMNNFHPINNSLYTNINNNSPVTANIVHLSQEINLRERLERDLMNTANHRQLEVNKRYELEQTKLTLIEKYEIELNTTKQELLKSQQELSLLKQEWEEYNDNLLKTNEELNSKRVSLENDTKSTIEHLKLNYDKKLIEELDKKKNEQINEIEQIHRNHLIDLETQEMNHLKKIEIITNENNEKNNYYDNKIIELINLHKNEINNLKITHQSMIDDLKKQSDNDILRLTEKYESELIDKQNYYKLLFEKQETQFHLQTEKQTNQIKSELSEKFMKKMKESEDYLMNKLTEQENISKQMLDEMDENHKIILSNQQNTHMDTMKNHDNNARKLLEDLQIKHEKEIKLLNNKYSVDIHAKNTFSESILLAKEMKYKKVYEKKLLQIEKQVKDIKEMYKEKENRIIGSLEECRRELQNVTILAAAKEQSFQEELSLKDRHIIRIQSRINAVDDITDIANLWRNAIEELSSLIIQTCATARDVNNNDSIAMDLFPDNTPLNHIYSQMMGSNTRTGSAVNNNNNRVEYIMVQKLLMKKALKSSKKIIERLQAEKIPIYANNDILHGHHRFSSVTS